MARAPPAVGAPGLMGVYCPFIAGFSVGAMFAFVARYAGSFSVFIDRGAMWQF